jgi:glycosyltransferase involved in cell wall biosynthesis
MIAPIFSGSGMRVKIIEAMSYGKCVLSTPVGAEGIDIAHQENILIANTEKEWTDALEFAYKNPSILSEIGLRASEVVANDYNFYKHTAKLEAFLNALP